MFISILLAAYDLEKFELLRKLQSGEIGTPQVILDAIAFVQKMLYDFVLIPIGNGGNFVFRMLKAALSKGGGKDKKTSSPNDVAAYTSP